jgi:protoheme IX farnesyltransferase
VYAGYFALSLMQLFYCLDYSSVSSISSRHAYGMLLVVNVQNRTPTKGASMVGKLKAYYYLTKPGIIRGNVMTAGAGFLFAARGTINPWLMLATLVGTSLVIASGCVFNNYLDRGIDKKMARTQKRALVTGDISGRSALIFASLLGIIGFMVIVLYVNWLVVLLGAVALFSYVVLYGIAKRRSVHGTLVGTIPGALPLVAGYCAASGRIDVAAVILFGIMVCWQMPHFYAIAIFRRDEYAKAGLPVLPVVKGVEKTRTQIFWYVAAFAIATSLLCVYSYTGYTYLIVMFGVSLTWLWQAARGFTAKDNVRWARGLFHVSLIVLLSFSVIISLAALLP